ncbi:MAG: ECF-type sigma factor [Gemmatimonadota bacterium]
MSESHSSPTDGRRTASPAELQSLYADMYDELRVLAHRQLRGERTEHTLGTTALVHEAYLKLAALDRMRWVNQAHVLGSAATAMRRILVDYAVARRAEKRGGGIEPATLDDALAMAASRSEELIALDEALLRLAERDTRLARVVECRFFGGMSIEETADVMDLSPATVKRDWAMARAWLNREMDA